MGVGALAKAGGQGGVAVGPAWGHPVDKVRKAGQPVGDHRAVGLEVELGAIGRAADAKGLVPGRGAGRQMDRALRPDVHLLDADREDERLAAVAAELAAGRAVFVTRELPGLAERYSLSAAGPLVRVWPAGAAEAPPLAETLDIPFGNALRLTGFEFSQVPAAGARWLRLSAAFAVDAPVGEALKVSARLLGPDGSVVAAQDATPVHWTYPTSAWRMGETVLDSYDFALPLDATHGALTPLLILYRAADGFEVGRYTPGQ